MRPRLRVVCAWCEVVIKAGPPDPVSHGICPKCYQKQQAEAARLIDEEAERNDLRMIF